MRRLVLRTIRDGYWEVLRRQQQAAKVPIMFGTNANEGSIITSLNVNYDQYLKKNFPVAMHADIKQKYPVGPEKKYKSDFEAVEAIETDVGFTCVTSGESQSSAASGYRKFSNICMPTHLRILLLIVVATWRYFFNASYPNTQIFPGSGAYHSSEIRYVFGNLADGSTDEQKKLSRTVQKAWADFAKDPAAGPGWDRVGDGEASLGNFVQSGDMVPSSPGQVDQWCDYWRTLGVVRY